MSKTEKFQYRAECSGCGKNHAVTGKLNLVSHGYERPHGYHANIGQCGGSFWPHFGSVEGRDRAIALAVNARKQAEEKLILANTVRDGGGTVYDHKGRVVCSPKIHHRDAYAQHLELVAGQLREYAGDLDRKVAGWVEKAPVKVAVEPKVTLIHYRAYYPWNGKACASSGDGASKGIAVKDACSVTCEKCIREMDRLAVAENRSGEAFRKESAKSYARLLERREAETK